jgi:peroxiredoxin family protein
MKKLLSTVIIASAAVAANAQVNVFDFAVRMEPGQEVQNHR